ncbi:transmembrane protein, putative (macronuclear) [Tetrahymena thermophila SB210]|uniref:Transmembrane protein, putative n=1 Tax=Tetrahymena thermophila (strain SB210) TaxID=312017 RepID=Q23VC8_TETTS|nr:transmembrane protein, putative [Tetrahymena thermophila SB210]EAS00508.1 transmembrane protein, putative [Tetrahymena thermophila SB210]|eukprot:XP_001020753.1 transmembrane protein, putative [Tetrahymena thermophila SB210]
MRICAFVLIALVAIAAAQQDTYTNDQRNQVLECMRKIGEPCQSGNNEVNEACLDELDQLDQCFNQCIDENKETTNNIIGCVQLNCKSENNNAQTFFDQKTACMAILEENPSINDEEEIDLDNNDIDIIENPCESDTEEEFQACDAELVIIERCYYECIDQYEENSNEFIICYKSNCKSDNKKAQAYFDKKLPNTSTDIDNPSSKDEKKIDLDQENINNTETPCQAGSEDEIKACQEELNKLENCLTQCTEQNKENTLEIIRCYKSNCKSENNDVQDYFEKKIASMNTGINILAFTVIASVLSLLL